jgi:hypothetical protein
MRQVCTCALTNMEMGGGGEEGDREWGGGEGGRMEDWTRIEHSKESARMARRDKDKERLIPSEGRTCDGVRVACRI